MTGTWQKDKSYRSKVWWHRLRRWEQSVCCVGDAPPRWPWPWKMTDAFDDSLENVFKKDFCSREKLYSPWRSEKGRLWLFDHRRGCALRLLSRRKRLKEWKRSRLTEWNCWGDYWVKIRSPSDRLWTRTYVQTVTSRLVVTMRRQTRRPTYWRCMKWEAVLIYLNFIAFIKCIMQINFR